MRLTLTLLSLMLVSGCVAGPVTHSIANYHPPVRTEPRMASSKPNPPPKPGTGGTSVNGPI